MAFYVNRLLYFTCACCFVLELGSSNGGAESSKLVHGCIGRLEVPRWEGKQSRKKASSSNIKDIPQWPIITTQTGLPEGGSSVAECLFFSQNTI
jgi:hypothetical protein